MSATKIKLINSILILLFLNGCAQLNNRNTVLRDMLLGSAVGGAFGLLSSNNKEAYGVMYAGLGAAVAGAASLVLNVPDEDQTKKENEQLKIQVKKFEQQLQPQLVQQGKSLFSSPLPKEVSSLVEPGEWKKYKLDQWVQDPNQPNTWYRQVEMFEFTPPVAR